MLKMILNKVETIFNKFLLFFWKVRIMAHVSELVERGNKIIGKKTKVKLFNNKSSTEYEIEISITKIYDYAINGCVMADVENIISKDIYTVPLASIIIECEENRDTQTKQEVYSSKKRIKTFNLMSVEYFNNINILLGYKVLITDKLSPTNMSDYTKVNDKIYSSHDEALRDGWKSYQQYLNKLEKAS